MIVPHKIVKKKKIENCYKPLKQSIKVSGMWTYKPKAGGDWHNRPVNCIYQKL